MGETQDNAMLQILSEDGKEIIWLPVKEVPEANLTGDNIDITDLNDFKCGGELTFTVKMNFWQRVKFKWFLFKMWMGWI